MYSELYPLELYSLENSGVTSDFVSVACENALHMGGFGRLPARSEAAPIKSVSSLDALSNWPMISELREIAVVPPPLSSMGRVTTSSYGMTTRTSWQTGWQVPCVCYRRRIPTAYGKPIARHRHP